MANGFTTDPKSLAALVLNRLGKATPTKSVRSLYLSDANYEALEALAAEIGKKPSAVVDELLVVFLEGVARLEPTPAGDADDSNRRRQGGSTKARRPIRGKRSHGTETPS
jgi:hypothetical protein